MARTASSSKLRPRNLSLAKANPASVEVMSTLSVTATQTMSELTRPSQKWTSSMPSTRLKLSRKLPPGVNGGGVSWIWSLLRVAMTNM